VRPSVAIASLEDARQAKRQKLEQRRLALMAEVDAIDTELAGLVEPGGATEVQAHTLAFIREWTRDKGEAPSFAEIAHAFGLKSVNAVIYRLQLMAKKGLVSWEPRAARSLRVLVRE